MNHYIYQVKSLSGSELIICILHLQGSFILTLAVIWSSLFSLYFATVDPFEPRYVNRNRTPGMSFRARGDNIYSTLIHFKHGGAGNWQRIVDRFMDFIKVKIIFTHSLCKVIFLPDQTWSNQNTNLRLILLERKKPKIETNYSYYIIIWYNWDIYVIKSCIYSKPIGSLIIS